MIVYVNGDSHAAAAECVNNHAWAEDDGMYWGLGQQPHPDNLRASFGCELANRLDSILICEAQAGGSNDRIIRTTRDWIEQNQTSLTDTLMIIQWSTWEREEWSHNNVYYQVGASGIDSVPEALQDRYRQFIVDIDWKEKIKTAHDQIWRFHQELNEQNIRHVMFNGNNHFAEAQNRMHWGSSYMRPYDPESTYDRVLKNNGFETVNADSWHFGPRAHCFWAEYLLQYITENKILESSQ